MAQLWQNISQLLQPLSAKTKRVISVGTRGSSKTTTLGMVSLACDLKSIKDKNFKHWIDEKTSGVCQVPSDLCAGYFPEPTPPGFLYEADLHLIKNTTWSENKIVLPWFETAGEDAESLIGPFQDSVYTRSMTYQEAETLNKYIGDSHGYILTLPVNRAKIAGIPQDFLESEPENLRWDPDVNCRRILSSIYRHKEKYRTAPRIEGIAVLLTKYDTVDAYLKQQGMNLYDPVGARIFMETYFRQTSGLLKYYGLDKVRFFPMHVSVEKVRKPDGAIGFNKWPDGRGYKIALDRERNLPMFSEESCYTLIDWLFETFGK